MTGRELVQAIRAAYPHPVVWEGSTRPPDAYCIGGALCLYLYGAEGTRFPDMASLPPVLQAVAPWLSSAEADAFGCEVMELNDAGEFEAAWVTLAWALTDPGATEESER